MPDGVKVTTTRLHSQSVSSDHANVSHQDDKIIVGFNPVKKSNANVTIRARIEIIAFDYLSGTIE